MIQELYTSGLVNSRLISSIPWLNKHLQLNNIYACTSLKRKKMIQAELDEKINRDLKVTFLIFT
jgi:hypothetical protein